MQVVDFDAIAWTSSNMMQTAAMFFTFDGEKYCNHKLCENSISQSLEVALLCGQQAPLRAI